MAIMNSWKRSVHQLMALALCGIFGCNKLSSGSGRGSEVSRQIAFDRSIWLQSEPVPGGVSMRASMVQSIINRYKSGTSVESIIKDLGPAKYRRKRDNFDLGFQRRLPKEGVDFLIYIVQVSDDYVPHDMLFSFNSHEQLIDIKEGTWSL